VRVSELLTLTGKPGSKPVISNFKFTYILFSIGYINGKNNICGYVIPGAHRILWTREHVTS